VEGANVGIPLRQNLAIGRHLARQVLARRTKYPLHVVLEPLFACNLRCRGCGKTAFPSDILKKRMTPEQALAGVRECGAPMVSIAGGEPLLHPQIKEIVTGLIGRGYFVYLCTNGLLLREKLDLFKPSPRFAWTVHLDGLEDRHDAGVGESGAFREAVAGIREAKRRKFRVTTNSTFFSTDLPGDIVGLFDFLSFDLHVDAMMLSPAHAQEKAADTEHYLEVERSRDLFRQAFEEGRRRWRLNHSPLFLDFLEGRIELACTPWAIPSFSVLGWQSPCYLLGDGYLASYRELLETTDWERYGRGKDPRCANCLAHCGYEPSAVALTMRSPRHALRGLLSQH
jgi:hopanoid biosynthesis associated radical SAM protein HpnH